ncbi:BMP family protein [Halobacterium sp. R2-5]|uniref:BMP family lipoprotein n=1 Tax=Halobacterium sp. R2-5 TaxID=2715751 RepID=UPI001421C136|nr:BMP family protein [Halobacterium sp. R2-5]NIB99241.1 BMP family ABC transporter substrate-binding protein [Halobacterium sp. R2-5]
MSDFERREFIKATAGVGAVGLAGIAGCTGGPSGDGDETETTEDAGGDGTTEDSEGTTSAGDTTNVGMVYATGGLGDGSFNDQAQTGIQQAAEEYNVEYSESQPDEVAQFSDYQQQYASSTDPDYDLVSCIGFLQADSLSETAANYPDQNFQIVDSTVDEPNVGSYVFREHEGSYLVGVLAGHLTTMDFSAGAGSTTSDSTNVGFVGGVESSLIQKFEAGFVAGVKAANDDVDVQTSYVGSFNDTTAGQEAALSMYNSGSDIVFHAAGNTGTGVFQAAQDKGRFAIGVDRDQSVTKDNYADVILASMVKRVDTAVYNAVEATVNGEFQGGETTTLGLDDDGVACVYGQQLGSEIPEDVKTAVSDARQSIIDGDTSVPQSPSGE